MKSIANLQLYSSPRQRTQAVDDVNVPCSKATSANGTSAAGSCVEYPSTRENSERQLSEPQLERLGEILDGLLIQAERGERPDVDAACSADPELADAIRHYVQSMNMLENAAAQLRTELPRARRSLLDDSQVEHEKGPTSRVHSGAHQAAALELDLSPAEHRRLGDYRLIREIGRGGMGVVYEAEQISLARRVALKILPFAAVLDARKIARFQNEAQAAASLHHPHIVPVFAVGNDRGTYFYSMQYIDGQSLDFAIAQLQDGRSDSLCALYGLPSQVQLRNATTIVAGTKPDWEQAVLDQASRVADLPRHSSAGAASLPTKNRTSPAEVSTIRVLAQEAGATIKLNPSSATVIQSRDYVRRVVELGIQAADALHHAHQCGIVHRDIKPSNLLVDTSGHLWITDFGLAQCSSLDSLTASGDVMGTLRYMSPEQAAGKSHWIDNRTDIYSLGQTLYELLTLRQAVDGESRAAVMRQIESTDPTPLRRRNASVPVDLENIVLKCLSKQREDRYATAEELASDLRRYLAGQTPLARQPSLLDRSARWISRHSRFVAVAGCLATLGLIAAMGVAALVTHKNRQIAQSQALAEKHLQIANEVVYRFGSGIVNKLELLPGGQSLRLETAKQTVSYFKQFTQYATGQSKMHRDVARALMVCADLESQIGDHAAAISDYAAAAELLSRQSALQSDQPQLLDDWLLCENNRACALAQIGNSHQAMGFANEALRVLEQSHAARSDAAAKPWDRTALATLLRLNLAVFAADCGQSRVSHDHCSKALRGLDQLNSLADFAPRDSTASRRSAELSMLMVTALLQAAQIEAQESAQDDSIPQRLLEQALRLAETRLAHARTSESLGSEGDTGDRPQEPSPTARAWHPRSIEQLSAQHDLALCEMAMGVASAAREEWSRARSSFSRSISLLNELCDWQPATVVFVHDLATVSNNLGQMELQLGQISSAERAFRESQQQLERLLLVSDDHHARSSLAGVFHNLAVLEEHQGQRAEAIKLLQRAITIQEQAIEQAPNDKRCHDFLAEHRAHLSQLTQP